MADVFLSYKREDAARVRKLAAALRQSGLAVWWDEDIPPSAPWEATIEQALAEARTVVVCWSPASIASENVRSEARVAREDGRLIQVLVKPCSPPLFFGERQAVDLSKWRGNAYDERIARLVETVRKVEAGETIGAGADRVRKKRLPAGRPIIASIVLLFLAAAGFLLFRTASAHPAPTLAVIPFEDLSPGHDKAYLAEGIGEEILSALSAEKKFKVLGRTSASQIGSDPDPKAVRRSLGITHLLEGSARTAGEQLRVNVRLVDTKDGSTIWQEEYRGHLADVFAVQDRISAAVAQNLRGFLARSGAPTESAITKVNAYQTYLAARSLMRERSEPSLTQALGLAHQVIDADPNYAAGHALYAELVWMLSDDPDAYGTIPVAKAARVSEEHARAAIKLAPNQAEGYAALGLAKLANASVAIPALKRAIALDPSRAEVRVWLATVLTQAGRYDEALQLSKDAAAIEPLWQMPIYDLIIRLAVDGHADEAKRVAVQYRARGGSAGQYHRLLFAIASRGPDISTAIMEGRQTLKLDPDIPNIRGDMTALYFLVGLGQRASIDASRNFQLAGPALRRDADALDHALRTNDANVWNLPDSGFAFFRLAANRDWAALNRLYDQRPVAAQQLCSVSLSAAQAIIPALRAAGRQTDERHVQECLRARLAVEARQKSRNWYSHLGDYEFDQATLAAFGGNGAKALDWLAKAIDRGWLGIPYSSRLSDRPQFDAFRSNPQYLSLQAQVDRAVVKERREVIGLAP